MSSICHNTPIYSYLISRHHLELTQQKRPLGGHSVRDSRLDLTTELLDGTTLLLILAGPGPNGRVPPCSTVRSGGSPLSLLKISGFTWSRQIFFMPMCQLRVSLEMSQESTLSQNSRIDLVTIHWTIHWSSRKSQNLSRIF